FRFPLPIFLPGVLSMIFRPITKVLKVGKLLLSQHSLFRSGHQSQDVIRGHVMIVDADLFDSPTNTHMHAHLLSRQGRPCGPAALASLSNVASLLGQVDRLFNWRAGL